MRNDSGDQLFFFRTGSRDQLFSKKLVISSSSFDNDSIMDTTLTVHRPPYYRWHRWPVDGWNDGTGGRWTGRSAALVY
jgi:hypothetical protein